MDNCKKCGAPIIWLKTPKGKWMCCDEGLLAYKANPNGKDILISDRGETIRCDIIETGPGIYPTGMARRAHWATCPFAEDFRKKKGGAEA